MEEKMITCFNKTILQFASEIFETFPDLANDQNIIKIKNTLETTITFTPHIPIKLFYDSVIKKYEKHLIDKDESFFLSFEAKNGNHPIDLVKAIYTQSSDKNKEIVWKYINALMLLSSQYNQLIQPK